MSAAPETVPQVDEPAARREFALYFLDLLAAQQAEGGGANKGSEWRSFIQTGMEEGRFPSTATRWRMPRSLTREIERR